MVGGQSAISDEGNRIVTRRIMTILAALVTCLALAGPANAAIRFGKIQYDSPGSDTGSNRSLNAEWFIVKNTGGKAKSLAGWKVRDRTGFVFKFPSGYKLGAGKSVKVHTGKGSNTKSNLYWKQGSYVWNNDGDKATLKNKGGKVIDTCVWGNGSGSINC